MMMVVNTFLCVFSILHGDFLGHARKIKFHALGFNVGLRYRRVLRSRHTFILDRFFPCESFARF